MPLVMASADIALSIAGTGWQSNRVARLDDGIGAWRSPPPSQPHYFHPSRKAFNTNHHFYIDGRAPYCMAFGGAPAATCLSYNWNAQRGWYGIYDEETFLNWHGVSFCTDDAPPWTTSCWDFEGVLTHELGHWAYLTDLGNGPIYGGTQCDYSPLNDMHTMCHMPTGSFPSDSYYLRGITNSDHRDARRLYTLPIAQNSARFAIDVPAVNDEAAVADILRQQYGITCFTSSHTFHVPVDLAALDALIASRSVSDGWLEVGRRWVGSVDGVSGSIGADAAVALGPAVWFAVGGENPHALEAIHMRTPAGRDVWEFQDAIRPCVTPPPLVP